MKQNRSVPWGEGRGVIKLWVVFGGLRRGRGKKNQQRTKGTERKKRTGSRLGSKGPEERGGDWGSKIENVADFVGQDLAGEGLVQEGNFLAAHALAN